MIVTMKSAPLFIAILILAVPAQAIETDWVGVAPDVSVRMISSDRVSEDGAVWMGLEVDMPASTKTYWRIPGESGIPLTIDTAGSQGIRELEVAWPYPRRETAGGYLDHAFYGHVVIPFQVWVKGDSPQLVADVMMGVCSDICVPVNARFELTPDLDAPDSASGLRIRQALATVPLPHDGEGLLGDAAFDPQDGTITVALDDPQFDPASMIAEIAGSNLLFGEPETASDGTSLSFPLLGRVDVEGITDPQARFTFDTPDGPFEILRPLDLGEAGE